MPPRTCLLAVDTNPGNLTALKRTLAREGFDVQPTRGVTEARTLIERAGRVDFALLDAVGLGSDTWPLAKALAEQDIAFAVLSSPQYPDHRRRLLQAGGRCLLNKPVQVEELVLLIRSELDQARDTEIIPDTDEDVDPDPALKMEES
ncbi:MAG: response regulator [Phycisphaeraceae bacterium]|nr:response regulator [Phycisphaeraceae bacterium]